MRFNLKCLIFGHDWSKLIRASDGYGMVCKRCLKFIGEKFVVREER